MRPSLIIMASTSILARLEGVRQPEAFYRRLVNTLTPRE
jgi:hypothetical protein